ncbi:molybdopterin cofactor-binding domain-containing protein [Marivita sp. XM-24bin2]|uniref:xanthine dehydrogenase family protein molybdopterin-binding subunit n=1 Tax=unclassified Marivita TaxID=2632480 RepID=UPI000D797AA4|nr:molybdopterin cofactor-binding domain-containing protein [Marivita sp. XM-24bin2]MCR9110931.1 molybdopterin-dependent oxidoreductase [Paracoccaceae bacterium]PWL34242.1 MAG: isoquinoline 1-oxidoreductase [Marivita sp. XM-24bin2]
MGRMNTIARRTFLIGSVAVVGGVAFGVYTVRKPHENPLTAGAGEAVLTPYVKITSDGIILITPRADSGQGVYHVQAALIAEELDVDLDQIKADPGPPSPAYWNTALAAEAAEFLVPAAGMMQDMAESAVNSVMKVMGLQITGGSTTVPDQFEKLRLAGASARETIKALVAEREGVALADLTTASGNVILPDGQKIPYTDLAGAEVVQDVPLRDPSQWRYIGRPMQRIDMLAKSTGTQEYGIDASVDGMVHATVLINPAQGGGMRGYDASEALAMRGVKAVVPITGGLGIVADNTWRAFRAAQAINVTWEDPSFPLEQAEHWAALEAAFTSEAQDSQKRNDGDVETTLGDGEILTAEYRAPYLAHAPLEPINAIVRVDGDRAEVWTGTQIPRFIQANVSRITGIPADKVTVHVLMMGGSFGHRLEDEVVKQATEIAMQMKGTPVKLTLSREEDMLHDFPRQIAMARMRGKVANGQVEALDLGIAMPSVMASQLSRQNHSAPGPDSQIVAGAWDQPFAIPHQRVTGYRAQQLAPISSWRSVGASSNGFFYNAALDELIEAAGADPLDERLRLCSDPLARQALEAVAEMSDWSGIGGLANGSKTGRGVALTKSFGVHCAQVIEVTDSDAGIRIDNVWVAAEVGRVVDPVNFENLVQGGVIYALGHAMNSEITYAGGVAEQSNFDLNPGMRLHQCPNIFVRGLENGDRVLGIGEPPVPPAAPALAGAIWAVTGMRLREMPFNKSVSFV